MQKISLKWVDAIIDCFQHLAVWPQFKAALPSFCITVCSVIIFFIYLLDLMWRPYVRALAAIGRWHGNIHQILFKHSIGIILLVLWWKACLLFSNLSLASSFCWCKGVGVLVHQGWLKLHESISKFIRVHFWKCESVILQSVKLIDNDWYKLYSRKLRLYKTNNQHSIHKLNSD